MSERYRILSINDKPQLQTGIPVLLSTYAISEDTITGKVIAQLKFQNIGEKPITAVYAVLTCYDAMSSLIEDEPEAKYLDMDVASGDFFGDRVPVVLPDNSIRSFDVRIPSIRFEDGTIVKAEENTAFNTINDPGLSLTEGQIKQLEIEAKDRWLVPFSVSPAKLGGKIRCGCSQWNDENVEHCVRCESDLNWLFEHSDPEVLQEHLEERLKEEALREAERQREEEEKQELEKKKAEELRIEQEKADKEHAERIVAEEKKRKKRNRIIIGAVSAAIVAALVYGLAIKPKIDTKNKYKAALALLDEKKYEDAAAEFEELGSYEDSENLLSRVKADQLYDAGKFSNAYEIYKELPAEYQIHENDYQSKYSEAENLLSKGEFEKAAKLFDDIRGYSDSAEKVDTVYYSEAETAYDEGDFAGAKDKFQKLGEYKDSASRAKQAEADGLYTDGDYTAACEIYAGLEEAYRTHEDDYAAMYDNAVALMEKEDYVAAADAFAVIESYSDSADHIPEAYYKAGEKALSLYDFETAKKMYGNAGKYVSYDLALMNGAGRNNKDDNSWKDVVARLTLHPVECLDLSGSIIVGKGSLNSVGDELDKTRFDNPNGDYTRNRYAAGFQLKTRPVNLRGEWMWGKDGYQHTNGGYATVQFNNVGEKNLDVVASVDHLDLPAGDTNRYQAGVQYWFYKFCRLQAAYAYTQQPGQQHEHSVLTQVQVAF